MRAISTWHGWLPQMWVGVECRKYIKSLSRLFRKKYKSGKTKCGGPIKRNVIFSSKTKCNKIKTHTAQNRSI